MKTAKIATMTIVAMLLASTSFAEGVGGSAGGSVGGSLGSSLGGAHLGSGGTASVGATGGMRETNSNVRVNGDVSNTATTGTSLGRGNNTGAGLNTSLGIGSSSTANVRTAVDANVAAASRARAESAPGSYNTLNGALVSGTNANASGNTNVGSGATRANASLHGTNAAGTNTSLNAGATVSTSTAGLVYKNFDTNGDNQLSEGEFKTSGRTLTSKSFTSLDANHDGMLNATELQTADDLAAKTREHAVTAFSGFDRDGDSRLSRGEYTAAGANLGTSSFSSLDANSDGYISNAELNASAHTKADVRRGYNQ